MARFYTPKSATALVICCGALINPTVSTALTFQAEAGAALSLVSFDFDRGGSADGNVLALDARYHLAPIELVGPWMESGFLQKSSSIGAQLSRSGGDFNSDTDIGLDVFFVTAENFIVGGGLSSDDTNDLFFLGGTYLDDRTTALIRISLGDADSIGAEYKTLTQVASGNDVTLEAGIALINAADTGIAIDLSGVYFLSDQMGVGGLFSFEDVGSNDQMTLGASVDYGVSETLTAVGGVTLGFGDFVDTTTFTVGVSGRF